MKDLTVSVAVATFNGEKYLAEQLDSILRQRHQVGEIVVCDDLSTDGTPAILEKYRNRFPGIFRIFINDSRLGCSANFEKALSLCRNEIIFLADQDDVWDLDKVQKMLIPFADRDISGVYSDSRIVDKDLKPLGKTHLQLRNFIPEELLLLPQIPVFARRVPPAAHDMAIRRTALKQLLPFPKLKNVHDTFIGLVIAAREGWAVIPEPLTSFRQHDSNLSGSGKSQGISGQLAAAKRSIADDTFLWNAKVFAFILNRFSGWLDDEAEAVYSARLCHSQARSKMSKVNFLHRWLLIAGEFFTLRYFRFARGFKSIFQDLFLR